MKKVVLLGQMPDGTTFFLHERKKTSLFNCFKSIGSIWDNASKGVFQKDKVR